MRSANILPFMHDPANQAEWQWPKLLTRRTRVQQPRFYWRGKALGGSSAVNAQIAIRGVAESFDAWAEAGCEGWSAAQVLPIFDSMEDDPGAGTHRRHRSRSTARRRKPGGRWIERCATQHLPPGTLGTRT